MITRRILRRLLHLAILATLGIVGPGGHTGGPMFVCPDGHVAPYCNCYSCR